MSAFVIASTENGRGALLEEAALRLITVKLRLTDRPSMACRQLRTSCSQPFGPDADPRRASAMLLPAMPPSLATDK